MMTIKEIRVINLFTVRTYNLIMYEYEQRTKIIFISYIKILYRIT